MTYPTSSPAARPPGRFWYGIAVAVAIAGWIGVGWLIFSAVGSLGDRMMRLVVPGQAEFRLEQTGAYTIFHEYRSTVDGRIYDVGNLSGLQVIVRFRGSALELRRPSVRSSYSVGGYSGRSVFEFDVSEPGLYQISAVYGDGRKTPQTVLSIDRDFVRNLLVTIFTAILLGFGGMIVATVIAVIVLVKRRRALRTSVPPVRPR